MKELSIEEKVKAYDRVSKEVKDFFEGRQKMYSDVNQTLEFLFPELKEKESEGEKIRKAIIEGLREMKNSFHTISSSVKIDDAISWLEKQGGITKLSEEEQNRFAKGVLSSCAMSFINYLDAHKYEDKMCVSNGECEDIENAFHNAMWDRLHRYYCKYIEKQSEPNPYSGVSFKYNSHTYGMCARDGGVEVGIDGQLKAFISLDKSFVYPNNPVPLFKTENLYVSKVDGLIHDMSYNPADKVEPKFKVGNWIIFNGLILYVKEVVKGFYITIDKDGIPNSYDWGIDNMARLWNIQDAKDGDVLSSSSHNLIWIYKDNEHYHICLNMNYVTENVVTSGLFKIPSDTCPATKDECTILFTNIKKAGFEWDETKKELKKIENKEVTYSQLKKGWEDKLWKQKI